MLNQISWKIVIVYALWLYPIVGQNYSGISYMLLYGIPMIYIFLNLPLISNWCSHISKKYIIDMFFFCTLMLASMMVPVVHGTMDFSYTWTVIGIFRKLIIYIFLFLFTYKNLDKKNTLHSFMIYFVYANCLYVLMTIVFLFFPSLKVAWNGIWDFENINKLSSYGYTARFGWDGFAGFRSTIKCSLAVIFLMFLYNETHKVNNFRYITMMILCVLGNMFYGRTGVVVFVIVLAMAMFLFKKVNMRLIINIISVMIIFSVLLTLIIKINQNVSEWFGWLSKPFINLLTTGHMNNYSFDHLMNDMIFMPEAKTFWLGDGRYVGENGNYYMNTDSGFMRLILFWGIFWTIVTYYYLLHSMKSIFQKKYRLAWLLLICFIIYEIKGEVYYEMIPLFTVLSIMLDYESHEETSIPNQEAYK